MNARARIVAELTAGGATRLTEVTSPAPFALRETEEGLFLVSSAQGLLDDDELELELVIGSGARLRFRSTAATVAYASSNARFTVRVRIWPGGSLDWHPEPLIATSRCRLSVSACIDLDRDASLDWTDESVLGRTGEAPGAATLALSIDYMDRPALRHQLAVGDTRRGWAGPAVLGGHRAIGLSVLIDPKEVSQQPTRATSGDSWVVLPLDAGGRLINAVGSDLGQMRASMAAARALHG